MTAVSTPTPREFFLTRLDGLVAGYPDEEFAEHARAVRAELERGGGPDLDDTELHRFDRLLRHAANVALDGHLVADHYDSMAEFWAQVRAQEDGLSAGTYWDSYEHGRRRQLEQRLAEAYGSPAALLVNAGMSAVYCAMRALGEQAGGILAHTHAYFETTELYQILGTDTPIHRHDLDSAEVLAGQLGRWPRRPVLAVETATNAPQTYTVPVEDAAVAGGTVLLDNSVLSHGLDYPALRAALPSARLIVVESGSKYLCSMASSGVVYGERSEVDAIRLWARSTGQQLQAPAFAHLHEVDIALAATRVGMHSRASATFVAELDPALWRTRQIGRQQARGGLRGLAHEHGPGALVFLELSRKADLDALVDDWAALSRSTSRRVRVQAGFGWSWTSSRAYSSTTLNQPDAPHYVRVSVGLLTEEAAAAQARLLNKVAGG